MEFIYFQSIVQYRVPINNGVAGRPEVLKTFTTAINDTKRRVKPQPQELKVEIGEQVEL